MRLLLFLMLYEIIHHHQAPKWPGVSMAIELRSLYLNGYSFHIDSLSNSMVGSSFAEPQHGASYEQLQICKGTLWTISWRKGGVCNRATETVSLLSCLLHKQIVFSWTGSISSTEVSSVTGLQAMIGQLYLWTLVAFKLIFDPKDDIFTYPRYLSPKTILPFDLDNDMDSTDAFFLFYYGGYWLGYPLWQFFALFSTDLMVIINWDAISPCFWDCHQHLWTRFLKNDTHRPW